MRLRVLLAAFSVLLGALLIAGGPASAKCGFQSRLTGPGIAAHGARLPCSLTVQTKVPREHGVSALPKIPAHHGPKYAITYPFTTRSGSPRTFVMYLYPYAVGGAVAHIPAGENAFNLFVIKAPITFQMAGSTARAFRTLHYPGRAAHLVPPEPTPATADSIGDAPDSDGGGAEWAVVLVLVIAVVGLLVVGSRQAIRLRRAQRATR